MNKLFSGNLAIREQSRTLFSFILTAGPVTRPMILDHLTLPPTTLNRALDRLVADGLIEESGQAASTGGRPASLFSVRSKARFLLGIALSGQAVSLALLDLGKNGVSQNEFALDGSPGSDEWAVALVKLIVDWVKTIPDARSKIVCAGLALDESLMPSDWSNPLIDRLAKSLSCPVSTEQPIPFAGAIAASDPDNARPIAWVTIGSQLSVRWPDKVRSAGEAGHENAIGRFLMSDPLKLEPFPIVAIEDLVTIGALERRFSLLRDNKDLRIDQYLNAFHQGKKKAVRLAEAAAEALALLFVDIACVTGTTQFLISGELAEIMPELTSLIAEKTPALTSLSGLPIHVSHQDPVVQEKSAVAAARALDRLLNQSDRFKSL